MPPGRPNSPGAISALADVQQQLPAQVENLQVIEHRIGNINVAERVRSDSFGPAKMSGGIAITPKSRDEFSLEIKHLHAAIHGIGHEKVPLVVSCYMRRKIEFSAGGAALAELNRNCPCKSKTNTAWA